MHQGFGPYRLLDRQYVTRTGHVITEDELQRWGEEAERGYEAEGIRTSHRVAIGLMREDTVESESSPGTYYHLKLRADGMWSCDCPGYTYRQDCKHARRKAEEKPW